MRRRINDYGILEDVSIDFSDLSLQRGFAPVKKAALGQIIPYAIASDQETKREGTCKVELLKLIKPGEKYFTGEQLMARLPLIDLSIAGRLAAKAMLLKIFRFPDFFRQHTLIFPATVFKDNCGILYLSYMYYGCRGWKLDVCWLKYSWFYQSHRVVALYQ